MWHLPDVARSWLGTHAFGPRIDVRGRELVQIALRDATNAMAVARTSENATKIRKNLVKFLPRLVDLESAFSILECIFQF